MKQAILVRLDLQMPKGKLAIQCSHASVESVLKSDREKVKAWRKEGMKKIILKVKDKKELLYYLQLAKDSNLVTALITDAGKTFFETTTTTCLAIGPDEEEKLDKLTGNLKLL